MQRGRHAGVIAHLFLPPALLKIQTTGGGDH